MPPDEARAEDAAAWLEKAALNLRAAAHDLSAPDAALYADAAFHAQQAAEKTLKAFLAWHDVPFRKTHNIEELGRACVRLDAALGPAIDRAAPLTEYAWKFRYPGEMDAPSRDEVDEALTTARELHAAIGRRLPRHIQS